MVSSFVNPVINPESKLGISSFDDTDPVRLWQNPSEENLNIVIRAIYKQVLGNAHVMESERLVVPESQLKQGDITVREFVRQIAYSDLYRCRFFDSCPRNRAIELNFKHLLGRAPESYEEITAHTHLLDTSGYEAEIDSYIDSDEYSHNFGDDTVPYYQGYKTQTGKKMVGFTHMFQLLRGAPSSDKDTATNNSSRLNRSIMGNTPSEILPVHGAPFPWQCPAYVMDANQVIAKALGMKSEPLVKSEPITFQIDESSPMDELAQQQFYQAYQPFKNSDPVELLPGRSEEEVDIVIRAVYRQVLGNAYVMESERLVVPESQLKLGEISVREFVRQVAKSELYRSRFFENCYWYRAMELNFKHLLGRAPDNFAEMRYYSSVLDEGGFAANIDAYIDSDEYQNAFGENVVPYYRGYKTQNGQSLVGFTNMFQLLRSASSSDKDLTGTNAPRTARAVILNKAYGKDKATDVSEILARVFAPKPQLQAAQVDSFALARKQAQETLQQQIQEQSEVIATLQQQLAQLEPFATIATSKFGQGGFSGIGLVSTPTTNEETTDTYNALQQKFAKQEEVIADLRQQIADARPLATIGEYRLNKWRSRSF